MLREQLLASVQGPEGRAPTRLPELVKASSYTLAAERLLRLAESMEPTMRRAFATYVRQIRDVWRISYITRLIERGEPMNALQIVQLAASQLAAQMNRAVVHAGEFVEAELNSSRLPNIIVDFDAVNYRAVAMMTANRLRMIREITEDQRGAIRAVLTEGTTAGENPRQQAIAVRAIVGLTERQSRAVGNFRRLLATADAEALTRKLRDRRFDPTVLRAIEAGGGLTSVQINTMVQRYAERYRKYRSEVIARTETLRAVHQGSELMFAQAIDAGQITHDRVVRQWVATQDTRTRDHHASMSGQKRGWSEPFRSGQGYSLRYPGDPEAPASETVQCRCAITTRIIPQPTE